MKTFCVTINKSFNLLLFMSLHPFYYTMFFILVVCERSLFSYNYNYMASDANCTFSVKGPVNL